MNFFDAINYMEKLIHKIKAANGVLPEVPAFSKVISQEMKRTLRTFYESDEISQQCPGKKIKKGNEIQVQKHQILCNLAEAFLKFKQEPNTIEFSTFCSLQPKHCIPAGSAGTHLMCVCTHH